MRSVLAVVIALAACSKGSATPPARQQQKPRDAAVADADPAKLDDAQLYTTFCAQCHGGDLKGYKSDHAPSLVNATFLESATDDFLRRSIALGRPGTAMAGYSRDIGGPLDAPTIDRLVAFIRGHGPQAKTLVAAQPGDATRGGPIYARNCQKCHGDLRQRGDYVHLANARFLDEATDSFMTYAIVNGRPGTQMEPWQGKLLAQDIADVVAYVRAFAKAPTASQLPPPTGKEALVLNPTGKDPVFKLTADPNQPPRYVSVDQVKKALDEKRRIVIIDARPQSDWMRVHVTGAVSIPYHDMKRLDEIPKGVYVVAYCACPHHLSGIVADELQKRGYPHALVLDEGILEWQRRGYPVVAAPGVEAPPKEPPLAPGTIR